MTEKIVVNLIATKSRENFQELFPNQKEIAGKIFHFIVNGGQLLKIIDQLSEAEIVLYIDTSIPDYSKIVSIALEKNIHIYFSSI